MEGKGREKRTRKRRKRMEMGKEEELLHIQKNVQEMLDIDGLLGLHWRLWSWGQ